MDPDLLAGFGGAEDAGVYRIDDDTALVLTVDFFTPVVDDPFDYGRIAAANSLSDVYAMGGRPFVALNIAAFPERVLPNDVLADIFRGGMTVAREAEVIIAGGHTVTDNEIKYGLSVVGRVHPDRLVRNAGARPGDHLILTKALGTGVLSTALKSGVLDGKFYEPMVASMTQLNRFASEQMLAVGANACTDITGNGLIGHAFEMAEAGGITIEIESAQVPVLPGTLEMIAAGQMPGGTGKNRTLVGEGIDWPTHDEAVDHLLFDPQTSGGLLIAVEPDRSRDLLDAIAGVHPHATVVGRVAERGNKALRVR